jgi:hypothetical protein
LDNAHFRPNAYCRRDVELVDKPACAAKSQAHAFGCTEAILKCPLNVGDTRPLVLENELDPNTTFALNFRYGKSPPLAVHQRIPREFARRRHELGSIERAESQPRGPILNRLAGQVDLVGRANIQNGFA